jgi:hypothetical protein
MNVLAASEGNAIFVIIALIVGAIGHWNEMRKKKQEAAERSSAPPTRPPVRPDNTSESEQERLRRFLENLGVPAPAQQKPERVQPAPRPVTAPTQVVKRATQQPRPPKQKKPRVAEPLPLESQDLSRLEEPASAIDQVSAQFAAMAKGLDVPQPVQSSASVSEGLTLDRPQNTLNVALRAMLTSPQNLRAALLAREILGPPKSLAE